MNPICFYHKSDLDGVCSAAIVKHFVPDCELYGMEYGDEFPWHLVGCSAPERDGKPLGDWKSLEPRQVFMVDFSLKPDEMKRLSEISDLCWCDHHKSAIEGFGKWPYGLQDTGHAACELTWAWFSRKETGTEADGWGLMTFDFASIPEAVSLLGRYDAWKKDDPEWESKILPFQYGCRAIEGIYDPTDGHWTDLLLTGQNDKSMELSTLIKIRGVGLGILKYLAIERTEQAKRGAFEAVIFPPGVSKPTEDPSYTLGFSAICMNTSSIGSASFDSVWDPEKHDVMVMFVQLKSGKWRHGIYSTKPDVDCSVIAKAFGGGGHKGAAGCETEAPIVRPV